MDNKIAIAMDLVTKMAVEQLAKEQNKNIEEVLISFMESNTGRMVYDDSTKLWWDGPLAVVQEYKTEMELQNLQSKKQKKIPDAEYSNLISTEETKKIQNSSLATIREMLKNE